MREVANMLKDKEQGHRPGDKQLAGQDGVWMDIEQYDLDPDQSDEPESDAEGVGERDRQLIQVVVRAFNVIDVISQKQSIGLSELARKTSLKKTTVARLVNTLEHIGIVEQDQTTHRFSLTFRMFELGSRVASRSDVRRQARPLLERYVAREGKSMLLAILNGNQVVYIDKVEAQELFRIRTPVGGRAPAHCTSSGKAILAYLSDDERRRALGTKPLPAYTMHSTTDLPALEEEFAHIRARGYAVDWGERYEELCAVGAPIFDYHNRVVASISLPRLIATVTKEELDELGRHVMDLAGEISKRMGWIQPLAEKAE